MIPEVCTDMLYNAADTVRDLTVFELRDVHPTCKGCASKLLVWELDEATGERYH